MQLLSLKEETSTDYLVLTHKPRVFKIIEIKWISTTSRHNLHFSIEHASNSN